MSRLREEVRRRRTFAIISHPDAGKTTLTEKLLLYGGAIHLANDHRPVAAAPGLDDDLVGAGRAQRDALRRILRRHPAILIVGQVQIPLFDQHLQNGVDIGEGAKRLARLEGKLEGGAAQVIDQQRQVIGVDQGVLGRALEDIARVGRQVLVERRGRGHQHHGAGLGTAPRAAGLLTSTERPKLEEFEQMDQSATVVRRADPPMAPELAKELGNVRVRVNVLVDERGRAVLHELPWFEVSSLPEDAVGGIAASLPEWRFTPATRHGEPRRVWVAVEYQLHVP